MNAVRILITLLFFSSFASAQILNPVKWTSYIKHLEGENYEITFTGKIDEGWSTYSQKSSFDGPIPTSLNFDEGSHFSLDGEATEIGKKKEGPEPLFDNVIVIKYSKSLKLVQKIKVTDTDTPITGYLNYMACDDRQCTPPTDYDFELTAIPETPSVEKEAPSSEEKTDKTDAPKKDLGKTKIESSPNSEPPAKLNKVTAEQEEVAKVESEEVVEETTSSELLQPVTWEYNAQKLEDDLYELQFTANVQEGWYIYSQFVDEGGPIPTSFMFEEDPNLKLEGKVEEVGKDRIEGYDSYFDMDVVKYKKKVDFTQKVKLDDPSKPIIGSLEFMTCDDTRCLPPQFVDFSIDAITGGLSQVSTPAGLPNIDGNKIEQSIPAITTSYADPGADCGGEEDVSDTGMLSIFIGGFIGGLVAILLPCIFPMIPITVSFFTKDNNKKGWINGLIYGLSIIVIFVSIGLAVTALLGPEALNKLSTNWIANTLFFLIFIAFAISFFGYFEITLPSSWSTRSDEMADRGGLLGTFFMAATLAIVSFSCTGPIIGTALVQVASSGNYLGPFMIMLGFSIALAIPFGLFAAFPTWLNSLPRSGSWMNSVKVVLGFLELALALKFLSVADMTSHWNILKYEVFMGLWVIIFAAMTLYLFGFIKFPLDSPVKKLGPTRWAFSILSLVATVYLASGFMYDQDTKTYNTPGLTSGIAPPATYNFFLSAPELDKEIKDQYPSYTLCANNIPCFKDYYEGLSYAKDVDRPMLVDFTGYGCVNCRKTEEHIWVDKEIRKRLMNDYILVSLYVDDRKKLDEILISDRGEEGLVKLRNVGNKWTDFQIKNFRQNSQPLYVMMSPEEEVLARPRGYREGIKEYADYLDCGLNALNSSKTGMK